LDSASIATPSRLSLFLSLRRLRRRHHRLQVARLPEDCQLLTLPLSPSLSLPLSLTRAVDDAEDKEEGAFIFYTATGEDEGTIDGGDRLE
jgi:hypothetical protein